MIFDTSILIEILYNSQILDKILTTLNLNENIFITSITVYEILRGLMYYNNINKMNSINKISLFIDFLNEINILDFNKDSAFIASEIWKKLKESNLKVSDADIMIASIAIANNQSLITFDKDFNKIKKVYPSLNCYVLNVNKN